MSDENSKTPLVNVEDGLTPEMLDCIRDGGCPLTEGYELEIPPQTPPARENAPLPQSPTMPTEKQTLPNFGKTGW